VQQSRRLRPGRQVACFARLFASLFERNSGRSFRHDACRPAFHRHCANRVAVKIADGLNPARSPLVIGRRMR